MSYTELKEPGYDHAVLPLATFTNQGIDARNKSSALLVFGEHAREIITSEVGLWLSRVLVGDTAELFGWAEWAEAFAPLGVAREAVPATVQAWVRRILDNLVVKLLPIENVDGRQEWERGSLCLRKTAKGVDLNRNYPFGFIQEPAYSEMYGGPHAFSEAQSRLIARLALEGTEQGRGVPKTYINVHSGEWAVYSPWDSKAAVGPGLPADLSDLLLKSGDVCRCMAGPAGSVSNYLAFGTGMDFMYTQLGVPYALTYEVYGNSGILSHGERNQPLDSYPYTSDDRIARTVPRVEDLLPPPETPLFGHSYAHRGAARAARARRSASHRAEGAVGAADGAVAGLAGAAEAGPRVHGWRRRVAGLRRALERRRLGGGGGGGGAAQGTATAGATAIGGYGYLRGHAGRLLQAVRGMLGRESVQEGTAGAVPERSGGADVPGPAGLPLGGRSMRHLAAAGDGADVGAGSEARAAAAEAKTGAEAAAAGVAGVGVDAEVGRQVLQAEQATDAIMAMVRGQPRVFQSCFNMFNPEPGPAYRDVVARWVVILLMTLDHVADPAHPRPSPHPLPGTVLAGGAAGGARRSLRSLLAAAVGSGAAPTEARREDEHAGGGGGEGRYGSEAFEARVRQRIYDVDPEMRRHSLVVLVALLCLGVVFVPWWYFVMERPAKQAPLLPAGKRPRVAARV